MNGIFSKLASNLGGALKNARSASRDMSDGISTLRDHIKQLKRQRDEVLAIDVTQDFAEARIDEWIDARVQRTINMLMGKHEVPPQPGAFLVSPKNWTSPEADLLALMAFYLRDDLASAIKDRLGEFCGEDRKQISEDDRAARVAAIDRDLLDAELGEESIIRSAEKVGWIVTRRVDADPRAVLAADQDLP